MHPTWSLTSRTTICFEAQSGYADPPSVGQGFASGARGMGAEVLLDTPALDVEIVNDRVVAVETALGRVETGTAVVAAGPWSVQLMRKIGIELPLKATRHEVFFLKRRMEVIPEHPVIGDLVNMAYMRPESPDLTLVGDVELEIEADPDEYDQKPGMDYIERMWGRVAKRAPGLEQAEYFTGYGGALYPHTGRTPDNRQGGRCGRAVHLHGLQRARVQGVAGGGQSSCRDDRGWGGEEH